MHSFAHGSTAALQPGVDSHTSAPQHCNPAMIQTPQHDNAALLGCSVAVSVKTRCSHVVSGCQHSLLGCRVSERCSAAGSAFAVIYRQRFPKMAHFARGKPPGSCTQLNYRQANFSTLEYLLIILVWLLLQGAYNCFASIVRASNRLCKHRTSFEQFTGSRKGIARGIA